MNPRPLRIGLAASRLYRSAPDAALFALLRPVAAAAAELPMQFHIVGQTFDAIEAEGALRGVGEVHRLPTRRDGGLIHLVAGVVAEDPVRRFDVIVHLLDPDDPTSVYPEGQALKRECVIHEVPYVSTFAHAREWFELARVAAGGVPDAALDPWFDFGRQTIALIAHDARKDAMLAFAREQFDFFDAFGGRMATGTTGALLNGIAEDLADGDRPPWVRRFRSGPLGGDAEIALEVLEGRCQRIVFFEDPHVARQHEADIQLLERGARIVTTSSMCVSDAASARAWIERCRLRARRSAVPHTG